MRALVLVLELGAEEGTGERTEDTVSALLAEPMASNTACNGTEEAALTFLRVVWVGRIAVVSVWVTWVSRWRWACLKSVS